MEGHQGPPLNPTQEVNRMSSITVKDSDTPVTATAAFKDAEGNATTPDDIPVWATNDATVCDIASTGVDGLSALLRYGIPGSVTVTCSTHDADSTVIVLQGSVIVTAGEAVSGEIDFPLPDPATLPAPADPDAPSTSATATPADPSSPAAPAGPVGDVTAPGGSDVGATSTVVDTSATGPSTPAGAPANLDGPVVPPAVPAGADGGLTAQTPAPETTSTDATTTTWDPSDTGAASDAAANAGTDAGIAASTTSTESTTTTPAPVSSGAGSAVPTS